MTSRLIGLYYIAEIMPQGDCRGVPSILTLTANRQPVIHMPIHNPTIHDSYK